MNTVHIYGCVKSWENRVLRQGLEDYQSGEYLYKCNVVGDFSWFQGNEEIYWNHEKVYKCYFHGGTMR